MPAVKIMSVIWHCIFSIDQYVLELFCSRCQVFLCGCLRWALLFEASLLLWCRIVFFLVETVQYNYIFWQDKTHSLSRKKRSKCPVTFDLWPFTERPVMNSVTQGDLQFTLYFWVLGLRALRWNNSWRLFSTQYISNSRTDLQIYFKICLIMQWHPPMYVFFLVPDMISDVKVVKN